MTSLPWNELREAAGDDGISRVPDGWYDCVVKSAQPGETSNKNKKVTTRFVVESGPYAGSSVFRDFIITPEKPGGLKMFFRFMAVMGVPQDRFVDGYTLEQLSSDLVGARVQVQVGTRIWNEQERMDVKDLKRATGGGFAFGETQLPAVSPVPMPTPTLPTPPPVPMPTLEIGGVPLPVPPMDVTTGELPPEPPF